jgi:hypothetical protein
LLTCYIVAGVCAVWGDSWIFACPLTNCTAVDSVISIHIFQSLVNVSHCLILTTRELYITAHCFWRISSTAAILKECCDSTIHGNGLNEIWINAGSVHPCTLQIAKL